MRNKRNECVSKCRQNKFRLKMFKDNQIKKESKSVAGGEIRFHEELKMTSW